MAGRCVVIGAGLMGNQHAEYLTRSRLVDIEGVCDVRPEAAQALASKVGGKAYVNVEQCLDETRPDIALVVTPDWLHREPVELAARARVPLILCEKPLATTVADAEAMLTACEQNRVQLGVLFLNRFYPLDRALRYFVKAGLMGEVTHGEARLDDSIAVPLSMWKERSREFSSRSSPVHFLLSHVVDLLGFYLEPSRVQEVSALGGRKILAGTWDWLECVFWFDNGAVVRVKSEWVKHMEGVVEFYVALGGTKGTAVYNKVPGFGVRGGLKLCRRDGDVDELLAHAAQLNQQGIRARVVANEASVGAPYSLELYPEENPHEWEAGLEAFVEGYRRGTMEGLPGAREALEQVRVTEAIEQSARESRPVQIARPCSEPH
ncbi:MAG: Gfo/Idh/MocA family oxidoreductase [Bacillota bacterium]